MELRDYFGILQRRWPIVVGLTLLGLVLGAGLMFRGPRSYEANVRLAVSVRADAQQDAAPYLYYRDLYSWQASEYLADDLTEVIVSDAFAEDVATFLNEPVARSQFKDATRVRKTHRILNVVVQAPDPERAERLAFAVGEVIRTQGGKYLAQLSASNGQIAVLDRPQPRVATTTGSPALDLALRGVIGLMIGVLLALLLDYLDPRIRTPSEAERLLGVPVLGEIPRPGR